MTREQRLVFGEVADLYDHIRPGYPAAVLDALVAAAPGVRTVEVGAGTGRATVELVARGCEVVALEPSAEMAAHARRVLGDGAQVVEAEFETYAADAPAGQTDVVAAFQAWHWVDPARGYEGAARLLRAGGVLGLCWNHPEPIDATLRRDLDRIYAAMAPGFVVREPGAKGRDVDRDDGPLRTTATQWFEELRVETARWQARYDGDAYAALLGTQSDHRLLPDDRRTALLAALAAVVDRAGGIEVPYLTRLVLATRR